MYFQNNNSKVQSLSANSICVTKSGVIAFILVVAIATNYIYGVSGIGIFDDLLAIFIMIWGLSSVIANPGVIKGQNLIWIQFFLFVLLSVLFLYQNPISHVYETYKLFLFLAFIPLLSASSHLTVVRADKKIIYFLAAFMLFNLIIIGLQYIVSPYVVTYLGLPIEQITMSSKSGRWVGLFESVNNLGDTAVLLYVLNEFARPKNFKLFRYIFIITVLISTSKHAVLVLGLIIIILSLSDSRNYKYFSNRITKAFIVVITVMIITLMAYFLNQSAFNTKFQQYQYFFNNLYNISESDARYIEKRALNIGTGLTIIQDYPFGVGLGVWGDSSARYNEKNYSFPQVEMSDSSLIHILVEQGVFVIFYIGVLVSGGLLARKQGNVQYFAVLLIYIFSVDLVTMGLSSGSWPLLFAYIYARLLQNNPKKAYMAYC